MAAGRPPAGLRRVGHGGPRGNFTETPCYMPMFFFWKEYSRNWIFYVTKGTNGFWRMKEDVCYLRSELIVKRLVYQVYIGVVMFHCFVDYVYPLKD
jgi:hypothetical protein